MNCQKRQDGTVHSVEAVGSLPSVRVHLGNVGKSADKIYFARSIAGEQEKMNF